MIYVPEAVACAGLLIFFTTYATMEFNRTNIEKMRELASSSPLSITVVAHYNPDGDAIGSALAMMEWFSSKGHNVTGVVPNRFPAFLNWMPGVDRIGIFKDDREGRLAGEIASADVIVCVDFNMISRLEDLSAAIAANKTARLVLIDHHLDPDSRFDISFSCTDSSSTAFIIYKLIEAIDGSEAITKDMAENLYVGIMTDTGNFSFSNLTPELFEAVADIIRKGVNLPEVYAKVYNSYTTDRLRLLGHAIRKLETMELGDFNVAYMTLNEAELRRFNFQPGDTEGFVNFPLTVGDVCMSAMFIQTRNFVRVSLRSRGNVDVSEFARRYFEGGGHKNAAGGKFHKRIPATVAHYRRSVIEFFGIKEPCSCGCHLDEGRECTAE